MKIRLSMNGRNSKGAVRLYRAVTEDEFVRIVGMVLERDGTRPWEQHQEVEVARDASHHAGGQS